KIGVIPHYVDKQHPAISSISELEGVREINVFLPFRDFVNELKTCDFTVSTSLHGIIISHAYGIPSVWIKLSDKILGDNFKFHDYYASMNMQEEPYIWDSTSKFQDLGNRKSLPDMEHLYKMQEDLFQSLKAICL